MAVVYLIIVASMVMTASLVLLSTTPSLVEDKDPPGVPDYSRTIHPSSIYDWEKEEIPS